MESTTERIEIKVEIVILPDNDPDTSYLAQPEFADRLDEYNRGLFGFIGVRARVSQHNWTTGVTTILESPGVWGIESDFDDAFVLEVGQDELTILRTTLTNVQALSIDGIEPELVEG